MNRLIIRNGRLILPNGIKNGLALICADGKIIDIKEERSYVIQDDDEVIDAYGRYVSPGFIDIHVHGGGGHDFLDGSVEAFLTIANMHARHGTTGIVPTLATCSHNDLFESFEVYRKAKSMNKEGADLIGLHLEGPFLSRAKSGAQDPSFIMDPSPEKYMPMLEASDDIVRFTIAPELPGAIAFGDELAKRGIVASVGHTAAVDKDVFDAAMHGYSLMTHFYNAMSSVTKRGIYRIAGAVEAAYLINDMNVEVIADGIHQPETILKTIYRFKGPDRTALCTDALSGAGMPDGVYNLGSMKDGTKIVKEDGVGKLMDRSALAGSMATTDTLVRNMIRLAGASLFDAVAMASATPARIMGIYDRKGSICVGKDADIVIFNDDIYIDHTIVGGRIVYGIRPDSYIKFKDDFAI